MFPNEELQTFLLNAGGLPDVSDPRALQAAGLLDDQLNLQDDKAQQSLANMRNPQPKAPPPGKPPSNVDKMLLASLANRVIHHQGPRFGITRHKHNGVTGHG